MRPALALSRQDLGHVTVYRLFSIALFCGSRLSSGKLGDTPIPADTALVFDNIRPFAYPHSAAGSSQDDPGRVKKPQLGNG